MRNIVVVVALLLHYTMAGPNDLRVSQASNYFATQLYQELAKTPGNVLICPVSLHIALALVHQGAAGTTASELARVLHLTGSNDDIKNSYKALLTGLQDDVLKIATKLYPAISFQPKPQYVSVAQQYFLSDIQALDYGKAVDAASTINKFVEDKTNNKIHDIIKPDSLTDLTRLIIVNAVHFKAAWAKTFPPAYLDNFKVTPTDSVRTEFLGQTDYFPFKEEPALGAKILKLDYENGAYSMVFVLPNKVDGLPELEAKLANTTMDSLLSGLKEVRVEVTIPKFKIEQEIQLKDVLSKMGIISMFDSRADLSSVAEGEKLYVDSVIQKTFIDVNEKGTEAAAATGVVTPLSGGSEENTFSARNPFHFYLIHNKRPLVVLFNGRLVKPQEKIKTPPTESNTKPVGKPEIGGEINRVKDDQQDIVSHSQGSGFNTGSSVGHNNYVPHNTIDPNSQNYGQNNQQIYNSQNINQHILPQQYGPNRNRPINSFNQNEYPVTQTSSPNYGQNNQEVTEYNQRPSGQVTYRVHYVQTQFLRAQRPQVFNRRYGAEQDKLQYHSTYTTASSQP